MMRLRLTLPSSCCFILQSVYHKALRVCKSATSSRWLFEKRWELKRFFLMNCCCWSAQHRSMATLLMMRCACSPHCLQATDSSDTMSILEQRWLLEKDENYEDCSWPIVVSGQLSVDRWQLCWWWDALAALIAFQLLIHLALCQS